MLKIEGAAVAEYKGWKENFAKELKNIVGALNNSDADKTGAAKIRKAGNQFATRIERTLRELTEVGGYDDSPVVGRLSRLAKQIRERVNVMAGNLAGADADTQNAAFLKLVSAIDRRIAGKVAPAIPNVENSAAPNAEAIMTGALALSSDLGGAYKNFFDTATQQNRTTTGANGEKKALDRASRALAILDTAVKELVEGSYTTPNGRKIHMTADQASRALVLAMDVVRDGDQLVAFQQLVTVVDKKEISPAVAADIVYIANQAGVSPEALSAIFDSFRTAFGAEHKRFKTDKAVRVGGKVMASSAANPDRNAEATEAGLTLMGKFGELAEAFLERGISGKTFLRRLRSKVDQAIESGDITSVEEDEVSGN